MHTILQWSAGYEGQDLENISITAWAGGMRLHLRLALMVCDTGNPLMTRPGPTSNWRPKKAVLLTVSWPHNRGRTDQLCPEIGEQANVPDLYSTVS